MGYEPPLFALVLRPLTSQTTYRHAARHDPLTALPDRAFLISRLTTLLEGDRLADRDFAVLFIDLDNFKQINDRYGHLIGDRVLHAVAQRLRGCVRECDHVTRYGGDEFVVLLERVSGMAEIEPVLARIRSALSEPFVVPEEQLTITLSIGLALSAPHLRSPDDVLREADHAMYAAKRGASVATAPSAPATF
jgi:diguanylate cyclase (GGDEF)-like protein